MFPLVQVDQCERPCCEIGILLSRFFTHLVFETCWKFDSTGRVGTTTPKPILKLNMIGLENVLSEFVLFLVIFKKY
jgi:hypothetical protein